MRTQRRFLPLLVTTALFQADTLWSQVPNSPSGRGSIQGTVLDASTRRPMEFARIVLYRSADSTLVTGSITDAAGRFLLEQLPDGDFFADVVFLGFEPRRISALRISADNREVSLGTIALEAGSVHAEEVVVRGDRPSLQYRIDRKVLDAQEWSTTASGTAVDILEQIPSVNVDIEGNVRLRGSGSFTVLIDGKPSVLDAQDALQEIPASSISSIEVITNPSAKFDPEGTAGVINIVTIQRRSVGMTGVVSANAGLNETYGGDAMMNYRTETTESVISIDHNVRSFPGTDRMSTTYLLRDSANGLSTSGATNRGRIRSGFRAATSFETWENGSIGLRGRYGEREQTNASSMLFETLTGPSVIRSQVNTTTRHRKGSSYDVSLEFEHRFSGNDHRILGEVSYGSNDGDEVTVSEVLAGSSVVEGRRTTENGPSQEVEMRLDYERSFDEGSKLEAGYQGEVDWDDEATGLSEWNIPLGRYEALTQFTRLSECHEQEHALYTVYGSSVGSFGYQLGIRAELTSRLIVQRSLGRRFELHEWDTFPTVHVSYRFADGQQVMASYTRRIERPGGWELEPFLTWVDATTVRMGNPGLRPEYIDSYEIGAQSFLLGIPLNAEAYYRVTHNRMESVRSVYAPDVTLETHENVGQANALGVETMATLDPWKWWDLQLIGNLYRSEIDATIEGTNVVRSSLEWSGRANSMFRIAGSTRLQFNISAHSPVVSAQQREAGYVSADLGIRQSFLRDRLTMILQVRDVFGSVRREETTTAADFLRQEVRRRDAPLVVLNVRVNLGFMDDEDGRGEDEERGFDVEE